MILFKIILACLIYCKTTQNASLPSLLTSPYSSAAVISEVMMGLWEVLKNNFSSSFYNVIVCLCLSVDDAEEFAVITQLQIPSLCQIHSLK